MHGHPLRHLGGYRKHSDVVTIWSQRCGLRKVFKGAKETNDSEPEPLMNANSGNANLLIGGLNPASQETGAPRA